MNPELLTGERILKFINRCRDGINKEFSTQEQIENFRDTPYQAATIISETAGRVAGAVIDEDDYDLLDAFFTICHTAVAWLETMPNSLLPEGKEEQNNG